MYITWEDCEFGAPACDCKRPYGNSDVYGDMAEILGLNLYRNSNDGYDQEIEYYLHQLHRELEDALSVIIHAKSFEPGIYEADRYHENWVKVI